MFRSRNGSQRYVIRDQGNNEVGYGYRNNYVDAWRDEDGNIWLPPTAWAYFAACQAMHLKDRLIEDLQAEIRSLRAVN